jgi:hypothetical protein
MRIVSLPICAGQNKVRVLLVHGKGVAVPVRLRLGALC